MAQFGTIVPLARATVFSSVLWDLMARMLGCAVPIAVESRLPQAAEEVWPEEVWPEEIWPEKIWPEAEFQLAETSSDERPSPAMRSPTTPP